MKIIQTTELEKQDLPPEIELDNFKLIIAKGRSPRCGINHLFDVKWFTYCINNKDGSNDGINGYLAVNLMFFRVDEETLGKARDNILFKDRSTGKTPNIDGVTRNIHPSHKALKDAKIGGEKICQLVLCNNGKDDPGPNTADIDAPVEEIYNYSPRTKVHKACYFPLIEDDDKLKENWRQKFLKKICQNLPKEILSEEILAEI